MLNELNEEQLSKITAGVNPNNVEHIENQKAVINSFDANRYRDNIISKLQSGELSPDEIDNMIYLLNDAKLKANIQNQENKTINGFGSR